MVDRRQRVTRHELEGGATVTSLTLSAAEWIKAIAGSITALAVIFGMVSAGLNKMWLSPLMDHKITEHAVAEEARADDAYVSMLDYSRWTADKDARWRALDQDIAEIKRMQELLLDNQQKIITALAKIH